MISQSTVKKAKIGKLDQTKTFCIAKEIIHREKNQLSKYV
jgi:hypothetical protein